MDFKNLKYSVLCEKISNELDDNADIIVKFDSGEKYWATFITYKNLTMLTQKNKKLGECLAGKYFWAANMVLTSKINEPMIKNVIEDFIDNGHFELAFEKLN